jgi:hypothetical protein
MSGNNSHRGQRDDQDPPYPSAHLSHVCLIGQAVDGPCSIPMYTR